MAMTWQEAQALGMGDQWMAQKWGNKSAKPDWSTLKEANPDLATWIDLNDQHYLNAGYLPPGSYSGPISTRREVNPYHVSGQGTGSRHALGGGSNRYWEQQREQEQYAGDPRFQGTQFMPTASPETRVSEFFKAYPDQAVAPSAPPQPPTQNQPPVATPPTTPPPAPTTPPVTAPTTPPTQGPENPYGAFQPYQPGASPYGGWGYNPMPMAPPTNTGFTAGSTPAAGQYPQSVYAKADLYNPYG